LQLRRLPSTDIAVSPIGLGTVKLGRDKGVKYPTGFKIPDDSEAIELLALARDLGINLLDTAPAYGNSEQRLGPLLKGQRQDWVICSKAGEEFDPVSGASEYCFTPEHLRFSVERSLQRLNTDYIDMLLIHSDGHDMEIIQRYGVFDVLDQLKTEGKILSTGMSTKTVDGGLETLRQADWAMVTYNLNQHDEKPVLDYAAENAKGILIKKALASGHICLEDGQDPVSASFDFIFSRPGATSAIVGTINPEHLKQNVMAAIAAIEKQA